MNIRVTICLRLYRALARAYPHEFQMLYGEDLERMGEDAAPEIWRSHGVLGLTRLLTDIALRLPAEYFSELRGDARFALRMLAKSPGFTAVGILSLMLGIGVCSFFFNAFTATLFHPLAGASDTAALKGLDVPVLYTYFERYREHRQMTDAAAFTDPVPFNVSREGMSASKSERVFGSLVSPEYFSVLGMQPVRGRFFRADTEKLGTPPVVVVSERFWRSHMNSDPQVIGRTLGVNGHPATILGVAPKGFLGVWPTFPADLFVPITSGASISPELAENGKPAVCHVVFRLAHGVKPSAVEAALDVVTERLDAEKPNANNPRNARHVHFLSVNTLAPMPAAQTAIVVTFLGVLLGLVLSLACTNLANLLLARSSQRRHEIAIRLSVGAGRFRLVRQLLTESLILSLAGGIAGSGLAYWLMQTSAAAKFVSSTPISVQPNLPMLLFTLAISVIAGVGFGLAPALATTRTDVAATLKQGAFTPLRGYRRFGLRNLLVLYQVAGSLTLLLITGYIVFGFGKAARIDPGFDTSNLTVYQLDPIHDGYSPQQIEALYQKLPDRLSKLPAVRAVTLADAAPFGELVTVVSNAQFSAPGPRGDTLRGAVRQHVGIKYFDTLGVPLMRGRDFGEFEEQNSAGALPVILNETAARDFFGQDGPLGRILRDDRYSYTVVGVVRDIKSGFMMAKPVATVFVPLAARLPGSYPVPLGATLVVRGRGANTIADVTSSIASLDSRLTLFNVGSMDERLDQFNTVVRLAKGLYGGIGVFGLILACIGLAGVTAYAVARRRKEIGIRMALGARGYQVLRLVMKEGAVMVAIGSAIGFAGAFLISRALSSLTFQLSQLFAQRTNDPLLLIGAPVLLAGVALLACYLPARRSAHMDPLTALRDE
ncbi:MAG: ABC transporter permease [Bryobacteraceae bacterium]|jgi:predicted permease